MSTVVTYRAYGSAIRHLSAGCRHLRRARAVETERETDLWPGFVCETCRTEARCAACSHLWPYCVCGDDA